MTAGFMIEAEGGATGTPVAADGLGRSLDCSDAQGVSARLQRAVGVNIAWPGKSFRKCRDQFVHVLRGGETGSELRIQRGGVPQVVTCHPLIPLGGGSYSCSVLFLNSDRSRHPPRPCCKALV